MSFNSRLMKQSKSTVVALATVLTGVTTAGPTLNLSAVDIEGNSLVANVSAAITTSSLTVKTKWQVSQDGSTWVDLYTMNAPALVAVAAAGSGSLVTTAYAQACPINMSFKYCRLSVVSSGATGDVGDNVTISYNARKRAE